ncbi:UNVERIFIED_ORG: hypothetical protein J2W74_003437 [Methylorubrum zatmanii]
MTNDERSAAEMRGLLRFAQGLGLDEATVWGIYEAVRREAAAAGVSDDDRMAEVRKQMLTTVAQSREQALRPPLARAPSATACSLQSVTWSVASWCRSLSSISAKPRSRATDLDSEMICMHDRLFQR